MNNDDIILLAIQHTINGLKFNEDGLLRFAKLVAQHEREACAKLAMTISEQGLPEEMPEGEELILAISQITGGVLIAEAIRARGQA